MSTNTYYRSLPKIRYVSFEFRFEVREASPALRAVMKDEDAVLCALRAQVPLPFEVLRHPQGSLTCRLELREDMYDIEMLLDNLSPTALRGEYHFLERVRVA